MSLTRSLRHFKKYSPDVELKISKKLESETLADIIEERNILVRPPAREFFLFISNYPSYFGHLINCRHLICIFLKLSSCLSRSVSFKVFKIPRNSRKSSENVGIFLTEIFIAHLILFT